jgi:hypothetical protein
MKIEKVSKIRINVSELKGMSLNDIINLVEQETKEQIIGDFVFTNDGFLEANTSSAKTEEDESISSMETEEDDLALVFPTVETDTKESIVKRKRYGKKYYMRNKLTKAGSLSDRNVIYKEFVDIVADKRLSRREKYTLIRRVLKQIGNPHRTKNNVNTIYAVTKRWLEKYPFPQVVSSPNASKVLKAIFTRADSTPNGIIFKEILDIVTLNTGDKVKQRSDLIQLLTDKNVEINSVFISNVLYRHRKYLRDHQTQQA